MHKSRLLELGQLARFGSQVLVHGRVGLAVLVDHDGGVQFRPAVVVKVADLHVGRLHRQRLESHLLGHVLEVDLIHGRTQIAEQPHRDRFTPGAFGVRSDQQVQAAIAIEISQRRAAAARGVLGLELLAQIELGGFAEAPSTAVDKQPIGTAHEHVGPTVAGQVSDCQAQAGRVAG